MLTERTASNLLPQSFTFTTEEVNIRHILIDKCPWFVAKDICNILDIQNVSQAVNSLDDDEKGVSSVYTLGGDQDMSIINESGLYNLIFRSRKAEAKAFRKWVTNEVLPQIRRTGKYTHKRRLPQLRDTERTLLQQIDAKLVLGDVKRVASELKVRPQTVSNIKNGKGRSKRILRALIARAEHNVQHGVQLVIGYSEELVSDGLQKLAI